MNEEELKTLWLKDQTAPLIDFAGLQKLSDNWHDKLRRKARIDAWVQGITTVVCLVPVFYYPRLIFAAILVLILGVWYVRELNGLYKNGNFEVADATVIQSIRTKIESLKKYFWRTRIAVYVFVPLTLIAAFYGIGAFDTSSVTFGAWAVWLMKLILIAEIAAALFTEIYFKVLYTPALQELKNLLGQLESEE